MKLNGIYQDNHIDCKIYKSNEFKIVPLSFDLSKYFYNYWHKHLPAPQGHYATYIMLEDGDYNYYPNKNSKLWVFPDDKLYQLMKQKGYGFSNLKDFDEHFIEWHYSNFSYYPDFHLSYFEEDAFVPMVKGQILGMLSFSRPTARRYNGLPVVDINRICFPKDLETKGKYRKVPSNFVKGAIKLFLKDYPKMEKFITYIREDEKGDYLKFAGFKKIHHTKYSKNNKGWNSRIDGCQRRQFENINKWRWEKEI